MEINNMDALDRIIKKCKNDKSFKKEWDESEFEYKLLQKIIKNHINLNIKQK